MGKPGLLLTNIGSPASPSTRDVRNYLAEFLMDPEIIDVPTWIRFLIVYGGILPFRPQKSAKSYREIWTENGSPLVHTTAVLAQLVEAKIQIPTRMGMRYGSPSIASGISELLAHDITELIILPCYPQFATSTFRSTVTAVRQALKSCESTISTRFIPPFFNHAAYQNAVDTVISDHFPEKVDHLLVSFHGLPERHLKKTDPTKSHCLSPDCCSISSPAHATCYRHQCIETANQIAQKTQMTDRYTIAFQSRLGRNPWIKPDTESEIIRLCNAGVRSLAIICPSFTTDCLETLEEINIRARSIFIDNGGENWHYIPAVNSHPAMVDAISQMI